MQRRRGRAGGLGMLRRVRAFAAAGIAMGMLLAIVVFRSSEFPSLSVVDIAPYKIQDIGFRGSGELSWTQESVPQLSKWNASTKLDGKDRIFEFEKLWKPSWKQKYVPCVRRSSDHLPPGESRGFLLVNANGGLNQMRAGISDMVAVARLINATLIVPELDKRSFWKDCSNFSDVFDEEHFIRYLDSDVRILKKLPKEFSKTGKASKFFVSWSGVEYYQDEIARLWNDHKVIRAAKSDTRLANNNLSPDIQKLRCRAFYDALQFAPRIEALGKLLLERMRSFGPYVALHLRYEKDMLSFSGCTYGLSEAEASELTYIRENTSYWKVKDIDPLEQRSKGYCPLTPKEVGIFLTALGYPSSTPIYVAAGEIYGGDSHMADLLARFPTLMSKETLASADELEPFRPYASQMAALDYIVALASDVFIPSYSGNMAMAVAGHRRYLGHKRTIIPDRKALVHLFDKIKNGSLHEGRRLSNMVREMHRRRQGSPRKRRGPVPGTRGKDRFRSEEAFYENPFTDCLCRPEAHPSMYR